ncbi:class I SAM-dependent methyltransferase [bacterium]|nr:class I SAM-dependent methyltransferase [bacterium]
MQKSGHHDHEWFEEWFDDTYLALYRHRNTEEARQLVRLLATRFSKEAANGVVDLACGAGRHSWTMTEEFGWRVVGLDLSPVMLNRARDHCPCPACPQFVRGDLRMLPFRANQFGLAVNLFTSFGYFEDEDENLTALHEMRRILLDSGTLIIDLMNPEHAIDTLVPIDKGFVGQLEVEQHRTFDRSAQRLKKRITIHYPNGQTRDVLESVRLFSPDEIESLLNAAGFSVIDKFGEYDGSQFKVGESQRMILVAGAKR